MIEIIDLGLIHFKTALLKQKQAVLDVASGGPDLLMLCEHPKTITLGRKYKEANLFQSRDSLNKQGFTVVEVDRGGDVSLHAPGQLIFYPILNLKRNNLGIREYLKKLEQVAVDLLADFDIVANGDDGNRGIWVGQRKIASIGVGVSRWVTYHGMGLNLYTDLSLFNVIRPCGLDIQMTALSGETKKYFDMSEIKCRSAENFKKVFGDK